MARKPFTTRIDEDLLNRINALAVITDHNINDLVEEAFRDVLKKYGKDTLIDQFLEIKRKATKQK